MTTPATPPVLISGTNPTALAADFAKSIGLQDQGFGQDRLFLDQSGSRMPEGYGDSGNRPYLANATLAITYPGTIYDKVWGNPLGVESDEFRVWEDITQGDPARVLEGLETTPGKRPPIVGVDRNFITRRLGHYMLDGIMPSHVMATPESAMWERKTANRVTFLMRMFREWQCAQVICRTTADKSYPAAHIFAMDGNAPTSPGHTTTGYYWDAQTSGIYTTNVWDQTIKPMHKVIRDARGVKANLAIMSQDVYDVLVQNKHLRQQAVISNGDMILGAQLDEVGLARALRVDRILIGTGKMYQPASGTKTDTWSNVFALLYQQNLVDLGLGSTYAASFRDLRYPSQGSIRRWFSPQDGDTWYMRRAEHWDPQILDMYCGALAHNILTP